MAVAVAVAVLLAGSLLLDTAADHTHHLAVHMACPDCPVRMRCRRRPGHIARSRLADHIVSIAGHHIPAVDGSLSTAVVGYQAVDKPGLAEMLERLE